MNQEILGRYRDLAADSDRRDREAQARYDQLESRYRELMGRLEARPAAPRPAPIVIPPPTFGPRIGEAADATLPRGESLPEGPDRTGTRFEGADESEFRVPLRAELGEGFSLKSRDDEYQLRVRVLDQTDFKVFDPGDQTPARSGLYIPRVRVYFEGQLSRMFEYEVSLQRSVEGIWDLLDGNIDFRGSEAFRLRFGRQLVPYSYSWFDHLEQFFIAPERGLFPMNFGLSRSAGLMAHGLLFDRRLQYAAGGFDGRLVGVSDNNTARDAVGYLNLRPFLHSERFPALRNLNIGASGFTGLMVAPSELLPMRTSLQSSENDEAASTASAIFLDTFDDVYGIGDRSSGAIHLAWYYRHFSLEAEWQAGINQYARRRSPDFTTVPVRGWEATLGWFVSGEEVTRRTVVEPLRPFDPAHGQYGPGAFELFGRYSRLRLGEQIFTAGLADPDAWTNDAAITDIGLNWYLNRYLKIYFTWQHSFYSTPVLLNPEKDLRSLQNDLFWIRCQLWF